jgi:hypothetical protein
MLGVGDEERVARFDLVKEGARDWSSRFHFV